MTLSFFLYDFMANVQAILSVSVGDANNSSIRGHFRTCNEKIQAQLAKLGYSFELYGSKDNEYFFSEIAEDSNSEKFRQVRSILFDAGLSESSRTIVPKGDRETHFAFRYVRNFTRDDISQAEYLRLNVKGIQRIADWKATIDEGYVLKANNRLKSNLDFGWLDIVIVLYVSETGREQFESQCFGGIHFEPAIFDEANNAARQLYELTSTLTMPPCLIPIQNSAGEVVAEDFNEGARTWDDAGYVQPILKYRREEVEALGAFDIAKTRECIGNLPQHYSHQCIVSQRFRKLLEAMKVRSVDFVPVELIDDRSEC